MLKLYNTASHSKEVFKPIHDGEVRFYGCGPTVYNYAHIGNMRAFVCYDLLNRYLRYKGYKVNFCMNLTDVDDKTIRDSQATGRKLREFTDFYAAAFFKDCETLNIQRPDITPRATEEIPAMLELIQRLMDKGYAYQTQKGDIYFKISMFPEYGRMAGIDMTHLKNNADGRMTADEYDKESAQDFALWKAWTEKDGENYWESPWGRGRPGWHIECSAMSHRYLGQPFDIHMGGIDLLFPHHTNEIAQSECAYGVKFVNYWVHNEHITVNGKKMSKSLGNCFKVNELLEKGYSPQAIRYEFIKAHYRQNMDFQENSLAGNQSVIDKFSNFRTRLKQEANGPGWADLQPALERVQAGFEAGMDDDLNTPEALAALFDFMGEVNKNFAALSGEEASRIRAVMERFDSVLGILPPEKSQTLTPAQQDLMTRRQEARLQKDWATADALKKELLNQGVEVKDTPQGPVWRFI